MKIRFQLRLNISSKKPISIGVISNKKRRLKIKIIIRMAKHIFPRTQKEGMKKIISYVHIFSYLHII